MAGRKCLPDEEVMDPKQRFSVICRCHLLLAARETTEVRGEVEHVALTEAEVKVLDDSFLDSGGEPLFPVVLDIQELLGWKAVVRKVSFQWCKQCPWDDLHSRT